MVLRQRSPDGAQRNRGCSRPDHPGFHYVSSGLLNKIDLLPHVRFDVDLCLDYLRRVNRDAPVLRVSAATGEGMEGWYGWLREQRKSLLSARAARLESELAALKAQL